MWLYPWRILLYNGSEIAHARAAIDWFYEHSDGNITFSYSSWMK